MKFNIRSFYLYLFSFIGLLLIIIGSVQLSDLALKMFIFKNADMYENYPGTQVSPSGEKMVQEVDEQKVKEYQQRDLVRRREQQASIAISMMVVGVPTYIYHWKKVVHKRF